MTCTHAGIFSPTHHFPEVKFPCLCGGGGGGTFMIRNRRGGGGYYAFPHVERFPRFHIFPFSTCPLPTLGGGGGLS